MPHALERTNDFVVKFANINGSGSASANRLFARTILRMGVPCTPRNIFPSNIQGLPTWYEVRLSDAGYLGARGGAEFVVALNPQSFDQDAASVDPGGYFFFDSSKYVAQSRLRNDVIALPMPLTEICNAQWSEARHRQIFRNVLYVGALAALFDMDLAEAEKLVEEDFRGKAKLIASNVAALRLGNQWARDHFLCPIGLQVKRSTEVGDRIFIDGNTASALGAVWGGATVCAWYPITPSTSIPEMFSRYASKLRVDLETGKNRFAVVQAEDELASIGMVIGAAWNGARTFTATSGPGISLMQEFLGLAYFAEIPAVIFNVQRAGPSTGMPTRTQQSDVLACAYASHGDTKHVLLFPEDPKECFDLGADAFDLADRLQTPVFVLLDLDMGMNERLCDPFTWDDARRYDRGKVVTYEELEAGKAFGRYLDVDGDGITYRTYPGTHPTKGSFFTRGTSRDRYAKYTEDGAAYVDNMERLLKKFETAKKYLPKPIRKDSPTPTRNAAVFYGSTSAAMWEAIDVLAEKGIFLDGLRVRAIPFQDEVVEFVREHDQVFLVEQNRDGQLRSLFLIEHGLSPSKLQSVVHYDGSPITARFIANAIAAKLAPVQVKS